MNDSSPTLLPAEFITLTQKIFGLGCLTLISVAALFVLLPTADDAFTAAQIDKEARLSAAPSPRLQLVGASNVAFGYNSAAIEQATPYSVTNMGIQAGIGLEYILYRSQQYLKPNDVVIVEPIYDYFADDNESDTLLLELLEVYPTSVPAATSANLLIKNLHNVPELVQRKLYTTSEHWLRSHETSLNEVYSRKAFNSYGDVVTHHGEPGKDISTTTPPSLNLNGQLYTSTVQQLNDFHAVAQNQQATVVLKYPCLPEPQFEQISKKLNELHQQLQSDLTMPIMNTPDSCVLAPNLFFDTIYHLNADGTATNTQMVIDYLSEIE